MFSGCSLYCTGVSTDQLKFKKRKTGGEGEWERFIVFSYVVSYRFVWFFVCYLVFESAWQCTTQLCCDTVGL